MTRILNGQIEVDITNVKVLDALIDGLSQIDRDHAIKDGLYKGGSVLRSGGKERLRRRMKSGSQGVTGNLLRSFMVRVKRRKPGVLTGFRHGKDGGNHASWVDRGTKERFTTGRKSVRAGISRGIMPSNYFWGDTRKSDMSKAKDRIREGIEQFVERVKQKSV